MHECVCVYVCVDSHTWGFVCVYMHVDVHVFVNVCVCVRVFVFVCVRECCQDVHVSEGQHAAMIHSDTA